MIANSMRLGVFYVHDLWMELRQELMLQVFANILVYDASHRWERKGFRFEAVSEMFQEISTGISPPEYTVFIRLDEMLKLKEVWARPVEEFALQPFTKGVFALSKHW